MGIGSIVFALPHFVAPRYVIQTSVNCQNISSAACGETNLRVYRWDVIYLQGIVSSWNVIHNGHCCSYLCCKITYDLPQLNMYSKYLNHGEHLNLHHYPKSFNVLQPATNCAVYQHVGMPPIPLRNEAWQQKTCRCQYSHIPWGT